MEKIKLKAKRHIRLGKITNAKVNISFEKGDVKILPANDTVMSYADGDSFEIVEVIGEKGAFRDKLLEIKGVGEKTAEDILDIANNEAELRELVEEGDTPFRNDVEEKLIERFR